MRTTIFFIFLNKREPELEPAPRRAKKYRLRNNFLSRAEFFLIMRNLPELVPDSDIQQMFEYADTDKDGRISFEEFLVRSVTTTIVHIQYQDKSTC